MNLIYNSLTLFTSEIFSSPKIVKKYHNETPEFVCRTVGGVPSMITATNIGKYTKALKNCNVNSAIVGGWNGEQGLFVLTDTNTLTPYEQNINNSCHVICDTMDSRCVKSQNPSVIYVENHRIKHFNNHEGDYHDNNSSCKPESYYPLPLPSCRPKPMPCPPMPCPPMPYPPSMPCPPIPYPSNHPGHHSGHSHSHQRPSSSSSSCLSNMGLNEQSLLPMILATALLKPETFPCLAPIINALKNDEGNLLCCNKIYDSNLVIDPTVIQTTKKNDE